MKKFSITELLIFIVSAELVGAVSALIAGDFGGLYAQLIQPPFAPPGFIFPIVWTILYALMGWGAYQVWRNESDFGGKRSAALGLYIAQLSVNFIWSIVFFRFRLLLPAAVLAVLLCLLVAGMVLSFRKVSRLAALINLPYLLWSIFAAYLAIGNWWINK